MPPILLPIIFADGSQSAAASQEDVDQILLDAGITPERASMERELLSPGGGLAADSPQSHRGTSPSRALLTGYGWAV